MNLKKCLTAAAAVLFCSTLALAQEEEDKTLQYTEQAITQSLMIFDAHKAQNELNDTDRAIETALNTTLPDIFNRVESPSTELGDEMENAVTSLAQTLLTYQELYPANMLNTEAAKLITLSLAIQYAAQHKLISETATQILAEGLLEAIAGAETEEK